MPVWKSSCPRLTIVELSMLLRGGGMTIRKPMQKWRSFLGLSGATVEASLKNYDTEVYLRLVKAYPDLTSGSTFDTLANADVVETYISVTKNLRKKGYSGIYVVFDEFSKYLESSIKNATVEDVKLLQDFAEACNRSDQQEQLHLLLISHKNLSNYIDSNLPKEKVDGWRGVSGRFSADRSTRQRESILRANVPRDRQRSFCMVRGCERY